MKARLNTKRTVAFFNSAGGALTSPKVKVYKPDGTLLKETAVVSVSSAPDLYVSSVEIDFKEPGVHEARFESDGTVVYTESIQVGVDPLYDQPLNAAVTLFTDDQPLGGSAQAVTYRVYNGAGTELTAGAQTAEYDATTSSYRASGTNTAVNPPEFSCSGVASEAAAALKTAIEAANGHAGKLTVTRDGSTLTLTQVVTGTDGNNLLSNNLSNVTTTGFSGGDTATNTAAVATVAFTGLPTAGQALTIVSTDGTSKAYKAASSVYTFATAGVYYVVWFRAGTATVFEEVLVYLEKGKELVSVTCGYLVGSTSVPNSATKVLFSKADGTPVAQATTDSAGTAQLNLYPAASYIVSLQKADTVFSVNNFDLAVVDTRGTSTTNALSLISAPFSPTFTAAATGADVCVLSADLFNMDGSPLAFSEIKVSLVSKPANFGTNSVFGTNKTYKTNAVGHVEFSLVQGIVVEVAIMSYSLRRTITVPSAATGNLMTLLSGADDVFDVVTPNIPTAPSRSL